MAAKRKKKKTAKANKRNKLVSFFRNKQTHLVFGLFLMVFAVFLLISFISFLSTWKADQSQLYLFSQRLAETENLLGKLGAYLSHFFMYRGFGLAAFVLPFLLFFTGLTIVFNTASKPVRRAWFWGTLIAIWSAVAIAFFFNGASLYSGVVGFELNDYLQHFVGKTGVFLILLFSLSAMVVIYFKITADNIRAAVPKRPVKKDRAIEDITDDGYIAETVPEKPDSELELTLHKKGETGPKGKKGKTSRYR